MPTDRHLAGLSGGSPGAGFTNLRLRERRCMRPANINIETIMRLYRNGWSLRRIAREFNSSKSRVGKILRVNGVITRTQKEQISENWRGYIGPAASGYLRIRIRGKRKLLHRVILENVLGRELTPDELVHHKDGNKENNRPDNLMLTTRREHPSLHRRK